MRWSILLTVSLMVTAASSVDAGWRGPLTARERRSIQVNRLSTLNRSSKFAPSKRLTEEEQRELMIQRNKERKQSAVEKQKSSKMTPIERPRDSFLDSLAKDPIDKAP